MPMLRAKVTALCPAVPGWRAVFVDGEGNLFTRQVAAWALVKGEEPHIAPVVVDTMDHGKVSACCGEILEDPVFYLEPGEELSAKAKLRPVGMRDAP